MTKTDVLFSDGIKVIYGDYILNDAPIIKKGETSLEGAGFGRRALGSGRGLYGYSTMQRSISQKDVRELAGNLSILTGVSIAKVSQTVSFVGNVDVFNVFPYGQTDPPIMYISGQIDTLKNYYRLWGKIMNYKTILFPKTAFKNAIKDFIESANLNRNEISFAINQFSVLYNEGLLRKSLFGL